MFGEENKECVNPWLGLLAIAFVCLIIASAIFYGFRNPRHRRNRLKAAPRRGAARVNFGYPSPNLYRYPDDRLVF